MPRSTTYRLALPLLLAALLPSAGLAQTATEGNKPAAIREPGPKQITTPGQGQDDFVKPNGGANSGPGSVGVEVRGGGTGAATRSDNSGASGNAERPSQAIGNTGGGGGGGSQN